MHWRASTSSALIFSAFGLIHVSSQSAAIAEQIRDAERAMKVSGTALSTRYLHISARGELVGGAEAPRGPLPSNSDADCTDNQWLRTYGPIAVVIGQCRTADSTDVRFTRVWARENGLWRAVLTHESASTYPPIATPRGTPAADSWLERHDDVAAILQDYLASDAQSHLRSPEFIAIDRDGVVSPASSGDGYGPAQDIHMLVFEGAAVATFVQKAAYGAARRTIVLVNDPPWRVVLSQESEFMTPLGTQDRAVVVAELERMAARRAGAHVTRFSAARRILADGSDLSDQDEPADPTIVESDFRPRIYRNLAILSTRSWKRRVQYREMTIWHRLQTDWSLIAAQQTMSHERITPPMAAGPTAEMPGTTSGVLSAESALASAVRRGDSSRLLGLAAAEYTSIDSRGHLRFVSAAAQDLKRFEAFRPDTHFRMQSVLGGGVVVDGIQPFDYFAGISGTFRFNRVWIWRDQRWQCVTEQLTAVH